MKDYRKDIPRALEDYNHYAAQADRLMSEIEADAEALNKKYEEHMMAAIRRNMAKRFLDKRDNS